MGRYAVRLTVAFLTFIIGIASVFVWTTPLSFYGGDSQSSSDSVCSEGLVVVESQPDSPLGIAVLSSTCQSSQVASVQFEVINTGAKPISYYNIEAFEVYEGRCNADSTGFAANGIVNPLEKRVDSLGGGVLLGPNGLPVPGLKSYTLAVCSVTFTDDSTWNRSPSCR